MKRGPTAVAVLVIAAFAVPACRRNAELPRRRAPAKPAIVAEKQAPVGPGAKRYPLRGVITAIDPARARITVSHEEIPGYMAAMTMAFPIRDDPKVIAFLRPGDRIEATLVVDGSTYFLEQVLTKGFVPTPTPFGGAGVKPEPNKGIAVGDTVPDFTLTDQTGAPVRLSQFRGQPVAVTFVYTRCPVATACPLTVARFSKIQAGLVKERFGQLLTVTVDPENDTPESSKIREPRGRRPDAVEVPDRRPQGRCARGRDVRRPLLPGQGPDRALAGGRDRRARRPARDDLLRRTVGARSGAPGP